MVEGTNTGVAGTAMQPELPGIEKYRASLRGQLIRPGDPDYDSARMVYNAMIDRRPRLITRCADIADVIASVNFAREASLPVAIRGGGHNVAGFGTCEDGLVIDMCRMKGIRIDPDSRTVQAQAGCTWGDLDHATHPFGLAAVGGVISTTGIAGLTLGGGFGYLSRKYGLSCDNLISADVVLSDGQFVKASEKENPDLFWALRGGGGNFGVVTSFEFNLHPVSTAYAGVAFYPLDMAADTLRLFRDYVETAPEELGVFFAFLIVPPAPQFPAHLHNQTVCAIALCHYGAENRDEEVVKPLIEFGPPLLTHFGRMPFPQFQSAFDALLPSGLHHYWKSDYVTDLSDPVIETHLKHGPQIPTFQSVMHVYALNGAPMRVPPDSTAYNHREAKFTHIIAAVYPDPADTPRYRDWVRQYWSDLHPYASGGPYVNFMMEDDSDRLRSSYGDNFDRLVSIKGKYDPSNLFCINQNIKPV